MQILLSAADESRGEHPDGHWPIFADKVKEFGGVHLALASYNAGRARACAAGWPSARAFERDEFIDDIPYPETQNYVKRILGTAEDYRRLYGSDGSEPTVSRLTPEVPSATAAPSRSREGCAQADDQEESPPAKKNSRCTKDAEDRVATSLAFQAVACRSSPDRRRPRSSPSRSSAR